MKRRLAISVVALITQWSRSESNGLSGCVCLSRSTTTVRPNGLDIVCGNVYSNLVSLFLAKLLR